MDYDTITFWFVCFACVSGLIVTLRRGRTAAPGWLAVFSVILAAGVAGWLAHLKVLIYVAASTWLLLVVLPNLLGNWYYRCFLEQNYGQARRLATIIKWLHPADGWRQQPEIVRMVELAQRGELSTATELLKRFSGTSPAMEMVVLPVIYRITGQWEEFLAWEAQHERQLDRVPHLLHARLRARGETGDLRGLVELYDRHQQQIGKLTPNATRDLCRLMLFAFSGKRGHVERLFAGSLALIPTATRQFWLATADQGAGNRDAARRQLEHLLPAADAPMRQAIERRLAQYFKTDDVLDDIAEGVIERAALDQSHEESFGAQPSLFSRLARGTQVLIGLNLIMFGVELFFGGSTNLEALYRLGALFRPAVQAGEWWRLIAALFLHFGPVHLAMNMIALWMLGPFAELALGFTRFLLVYLLTGIGSMGFVMAFASGPGGHQITVGASGSVMGLIGATGALMLRGWRREKAQVARRRLVAMLVIVGTQAAFDSLVPNVSMAAHLSGAVIGFAATFALPDRLAAQRIVIK